MKTIIQKPIAHVCTEEIPHSIRYSILGKDYDDHPYNEIYIGNTKQINDPINIQALRKILNNLEAKGANYVAIDFHTDHQEYELDGVHIGLATQEEIDEHNLKDRDFHIKFIKDKLTELDKLTSQYKEKLKELSGE